MDRGVGVCNVLLNRSHVCCCVIPVHTHTHHFSPTFRPNRDVNCLICLLKKKPGQEQILTGRQGREFAGGAETIKACELEDPSEGQNTASAQSGRGELSILSFLLPQAGCQRYQTQNLSIIFRHLLHALI